MAMIREATAPKSIWTQKDMIALEWFYQIAWRWMPYLIWIREFIIALKFNENTIREGFKRTIWKHGSKTQENQCCKIEIEQSRDFQPLDAGRLSRRAKIWRCFTKVRNSIWSCRSLFAFSRVLYHHFQKPTVASLHVFSKFNTPSISRISHFAKYQTGKGKPCTGTTQTLLCD
jgi:hypothetical protein